MTLMTKRQAYLHLVNLASENNSKFKTKGKDKKGRCTTNSGRNDIHHRDRTEFLKQIDSLRNIVNSVEDTEKIDIKIPKFLPRPKPIIQGKRMISSKYNKTCKCQIKIYDGGCTYWTSWNNQYWITKGFQLKQYRNMIDMKFTNSIPTIKKQKVILSKSDSVIVGGVSLLPLIVVGLLLYTSMGKN
jgi:hypothetical protein